MQEQRATGALRRPRFRRQAQRVRVRPQAEGRGRAVPARPPSGPSHADREAAPLPSTWPRPVPTPPPTPPVSPPHRHYHATPARQCPQTHPSPRKSVAEGRLPRQRPRARAAHAQPALRHRSVTPANLVSRLLHPKSGRRLGAVRHPQAAAGAISRHWETHPVPRATAKMGVNMQTGMPSARRQIPE